MASFNTYDYQFLTKCLAQGSLAFKSQSIKRLTTLSQNDKKQFQIHCKNILTIMEQLYLQDKQDLNILTTLLLSEIILNIITKQNQQLIKGRHLKFLIFNLGHSSKPSIRKASHTCLLAFIKTYHNFDYMLDQYLDAGFQNQNTLICQKAINSFQSIFILELRHFNWSSQSSKKLLQCMITKAGDDNLQIAKAAAQCLLSLCKNQGIKETASMLSIGYLQKMQDFVNTTEQKLPNADLKITSQNILQIMDNLRKKPKQEPIKDEPAQQLRQQKPLQLNSQNLVYQRRLEKIKKSISAHQEKQKKVQKQPQQAGINFVKLFNNVHNESSLKQRTDAVEDILFKIQTNKNKLQFQASIKAAIPSILKLLRDPNPKIVGLTLKILQNIVQELKSSDAYLQNLISVIIQKLGDQKISIRQIVSKVIRQLINKTQKGIWIKELLQNIRKNTNTFLKDQTLNIIHTIYEQNQIENIDYPTDDLISKIVVFTDDPKTKIKIRTLDCLAQIVFKSGQIQLYNERLKKQMTQIFYQMYLQKVNKLTQERQKKLMMQLQKKRKIEQTNNFRTTYQQRANSYRKQDSQDQSKLNVSLDVVKKRINNLRTKRTALSTRQTSSLGRTYHTIQKHEISANLQQDDITLPSLVKKTQTNRLSLNKRLDSSPMKTIENKNSDYMSKQDLKPLSQPDKQFKNIMCDLKSGDWKVQFQTTNKLRRLIQFNPQLILSAPSTNLHIIILDLLSLIQSLRSTVSKNALICLNQIIIALGKQVDPQMEVILQKLMKKSADTNVFLSSQVQKCLRTLSLTASPAKVLEKLSIYKDSKNFPIKDAFINTLLIMKDQQKIRSKQYGKLAQTMAFFLTQGQLDLRSKAKSGITDICNHLGDWYRFLRGKVNSNSFKLICQLMTKNAMNGSNMNEPLLTPIKTKKQSSTLTDIKSFTLQPKQLEKEQSIMKTEAKSTRRNFVKIQQFPNQFNQISGLIDLSSSSQWKKRIQSVQGLKLLAVKYPNQFMQYRSSCHFLDILSKQIAQPNLKVSVNAMQVFMQIFQPLQKLVQNNLNVISSSIFNALSSAKVEVKQMAQKCASALIQRLQMQVMLQPLCQGILYSLPKSRIYLLNKLEDQIDSIHSDRKQLLFKHVFPLLNKLMQQYKAELMPNVVNFFIKLYDIMGNNMFSHVTKFKQVRQLIGK